MKLKIIFDLIFLFLSTIFIQAQDSSHTFLFKTSFMEVSFKYPGYFEVVSYLDEDHINQTKFIVSINTNEKTSDEPISLDLYLAEKSARETVPAWGFAFKNNKWVNNRGKDLLSCSDFDFEGWQGVKVDNNTWKDLPWEFFLSKKINAKLFIIVGSGLESKNFNTALKSISSSLNFSETFPISNYNLTFNNIKEVDFFNMEYTLYEDEELPDDIKAKVTVKDGKYFETTKEDRWTIYYFAIDEVKFGDITGDGIEDAVITSGEKEGGGTGWDTQACVFSLVNGKPKQIFLYQGGDRAPHGIKEVEIKNGLLYISQFDGYLTPCCADFVYTLSYKWNGQEFIQKNCEQYLNNNDNYLSNIVYKDTLYSKDLVKGIIVWNSLKYWDWIKLELIKGQNLQVEVISSYPEEEVYLILTNQTGKIINHCKDFRTNKLNVKIPSDGFYSLKIRLTCSQYANYRGEFIVK